MKLFCKHLQKQAKSGWRRPICKDCPMRAVIEAKRRSTR